MSDTMACPRSDVLLWLRTSLLIAILCLRLGSGSPVHGQTDSAPAASETPPTPPDLRFAIGWVSTGGSYTYLPEKWGELHINLVNARDVPRELICVTYFDDQPTLQFGRRVWVPPQSKLQISHPVLVPKCDPAKGRSLGLHSLVMDGTTADDVLIKNDSGKLLHDGALLVTLTPRNTAIIGIPSADEEVPPAEVMNLVAASRVSQQLNNRVTLLLDQFLPPDETSLSSLDHIVLVENRIADDFAAMSALRHWLHAGGRLWIMLDRVDPIVLERLFGDEFDGYVVDHVGLTTVRVDKKPKLMDLEVPLGETTEYEEPVELARVVMPNMTVTHTVDGWPAALTRSYGDGMVLITTLGARGWMKPYPRHLREPDDLSMRTNFVPTAAFSEVIPDFFTQRESELLPQPVLEPKAREYIGYAIPSWGVVVGTLIGFSAALAIACLWLLRSGRLEHLGWMGTVMAVAVSALLLMMGRSSQQAIPGTVAGIQLVQSIPGTDEVRSEGLLAVYQPDGTQTKVEATTGGRLLPDMAGLEGTNRRMVTTDLGQWHWENLATPPGLRSAPFATAETVVDRIEAHGTFDANGIVGQYAGATGRVSDAVIATRDGRIGVTLQSNGKFTASANDIFDKDQYLGATLLNDEQDRRRRLLENLLNNPKRRDFPDRPQLLFWADSWDAGFRFADGFKNRGATLMMVPLVIERPENGTEIVIPSPFLSYRNRNRPDGTPSSTMWNYGRKEWQERSTPGETWLSFQVPRELLPLTANKARVEISVTGPVGRLELMGMRQGEMVPIQKIMDPVGTVSIDITDAGLLTISDEGWLNLGLTGGDPDRPELTKTEASKSNETGPNSKKKSATSDAKVNYWRIESLTLQLWAKTTEPTAKD